jgi:hypothetical protein
MNWKVDPTAIVNGKPNTPTMMKKKSTPMLLAISRTAPEGIVACFS